jgi:glycerol-3-phosphate dehydrogenase
VVADLAFSRAELVHCARSEMVVHLEDLLRRRLPLVILARVREEWVADAARLAAPELGWDAARIREEVDAVVDRWGQEGHR